MSSNPSERRAHAFLRHAVDPLPPSIEPFVAEIGSVAALSGQEAF